ncbi:MAG: hypothetical protein JSU85_13950 [Candidatus Zixiibacteriota bacterium]|nr:MAG: hypothetical protein JSU85_13950 [candidate division Zixibacteria bacterium]
MIRVACVLKYGGDYDCEYVKSLYVVLNRYSHLPLELICLTDIASEVGKLGIQTQILEEDWPGWWSKMELFSLEGPVLYFDLDTAIVGDIRPLGDYITKLPDDEFLMLRGFYKNDPCSGIMGWNGDWSWMKEEFRTYVEFSGHFYKRAEHYELACSVGQFRGDQNYIARSLGRVRMKITMAQDIMDGIYSYKVHIREKNRMPADAKIICFHGKPRPADADISNLKAVI